MNILRTIAAGASAAAFAFGCIAAASAASSTPTNGAAAADLYQAGGTPGSFSTVRALDAMIGQPGATAEIKKLKAEYGDATIDRFEKVSDFAMNDAWERAGRDDVTFPSPVTMDAATLTSSIVRAGVAANGAFEMPTFLDNLFTSGVRAQVMTDVDAKFGAGSSAQYHRVGNQLFYDLAQKAGMASVTLAADH